MKPNKKVTHSIELPTQLRVIDSFLYLKMIINQNPNFKFNLIIT